MATDLISINAELERLTKALGEAVRQYEVVSREAAETRSAYDVAKAQCLLKAGGSSRELREAEAILSCKVEMLAARIAENMRDALRERVRAIQTIISVQQSRLRFYDLTEK
jgi:hypothetical protein